MVTRGRVEMFTKVAGQEDFWEEREWCRQETKWEEQRP